MKKILLALLLFPVCLIAFQMQIEELSIRNNIGSALADTTDFIFLNTGDDFIRIRLEGINHSYIVRFNGYSAKIPVENENFQIPTVLVAKKFISLEYSNDGLRISGTDLFLEPRSF